MPEEQKTGVAGTLDTVNDVAESFLSLFPAALTAYKLLHMIWTKTNPGKSFEEYNAYLYTQSEEVGGFSRNWLAAHGYTQQPDGTWVKTGATGSAGATPQPTPGGPGPGESTTIGG